MRDAYQVCSHISFHFGLTLTQRGRHDYILTEEETGSKKLSNLKKFPLPLSAI